MVQKRNYGIDLLRIIATLMIIILHILGAGGVIYTIDSSSPVYETAWLLEFLAYCAVNCYAIISGYVGVDSKFRVSNILRLWLQVVATTMAITICFWVTGFDVTRADLLQAVLPVSKQTFWYFTAYFCVFWLSPFLNRMIKGMTKKEASGFVALTIVLFSLMPTIFKADMFLLRGGYSAAWLAILYVIGGIIKTHYSELKIKKRVLVLLYLASVLVTILSKLIIEFMGVKWSFSFYESNFLMNYNSPTMILAAGSLVLLFVNLNVEKISKFISVFAPFTFGIYIIHVHPFVWNHLISNRFTGLTRLNPILLCICVLGLGIVIFMICSVLEFVRIWIFKIIRVPVFCKWIDEKTQQRFR